MNLGVMSDAIFFVDRGVIAKEILYPEFEAILDHVVGLDDYKSRQMPAIFLRINTRLKITAAVCFLIDFDAQGYADKSWNIPLQHLAENAGRGPDLGAGPIRLSCRSQCSVSWHQRSLWDPVLDAEAGNTMALAAHAVSRNRLGLLMDEDDIAVPSSAVSQTFSSVVSDRHIRDELTQEFKARSAVLLEEQKLRIAAMKLEAQEHLEKLQIHYREEHLKLAAALDSTKRLFAEEKHKNIQLKKTIDSQADNLHEAREHYQQQLKESKTVSDEQLAELESRFRQEMASKLESDTIALKEQLDMREVELYYRDEQVKRQAEEIEAHREEKQQLLDSNGDKMLQRLIDRGITFVAYQPGSDHLTIPLRDVSDYIESPADYVANKLSIDTVLYQQWLKHYETPICTHSSGDSEMCGKVIPKVEKPARFIIGESDRCVKHSRASNVLSELMKVR